MNHFFKIAPLVAFSFLATSNANAQFGKLADKVKSEIKNINPKDNTGLGLKEALDKGVESAVSQLGIENGYMGSIYKVLIPEDAQKIINVVKKVPGFQDVETNLIKKMNDASSIAVKKASPIFVDAIKKMTFQDALTILKGSNDAATNYLESSSRKALYDAFLPVLQASLDEVNARTYWKSVTDAYNKIPLQKKINPNLDAHVNNKALDGLFGLIKVKENGIRTDISQRTSPLLKEVFGTK
jgi:copper chaperone CopZ